MGQAPTKTEADTTTSHYVLGDYLIGIEGMAILRDAMQRRFDRLELRRAEIQGILGGLSQPPLSSRRDLRTANVHDSYTTWSDTYDHPTELDPDPVKALEGPVMRRLIAELPGGPVLDAACGTGRHTEYLVKAGLDVIGVDANEAMLAKAREKLPEVDFRTGDLTDLPFEDASFRSLICGLAFSHLPEIGPAVDEVARVLKPGGQAAISVPHPFVTYVLGWRAPVFDAEGAGWEVPEYEHLPSDYVEAFASGGLAVRHCFEPRLTPEQARWNPEAEEGEENPFAEALEDALAGQPGALIWVVERP